MRNRKSSISGVILAISILFAISILGPSVTADTPLDKGTLRTIDGDYGAVDAQANGGGSEFVPFISSPFVITVNCSYEDINEFGNGSRHRFLVYLENIDTTETNTTNVWFDLNPNEGRFYYDLVGSINASKYDTIAVHIYCGVTDFFTNNVDEDDDDFLIWLI